MPFVGGADTLTLTVDPYDGTTAAAIEIHGPNDTTVDPDSPPSTDDGGHTWSVPLIWPAAGLWVPVWTVTGTGAGVRPRTVNVEAIPTSTGPAWRPSCTEVARWVPDRTLALVRTGPGTGANPAQYTFDDSTTPTGEVVDGLATDAATWVLTATGPIADAPDYLAQMATATAAVFAAAAVERGYPDQDSDKSIADELLKLAISMRVDLKAANEAATGTDPSDPAAQLVPIFQFPPPPAWGDREFN